MKHSSTSIYDSIKQVGVDLGCPTLLAGLSGVRAAEYFEPVSNSTGLNQSCKTFDEPDSYHLILQKEMIFLSESMYSFNVDDDEGVEARIQLNSWPCFSRQRQVTY